MSSLVGARIGTPSEGKDDGIGLSEGKDNGTGTRGVVSVTDASFLRNRLSQATHRQA